MIRSFLLNFLWAYLIMGLCRTIFVAENWGLLAPQLTAEPWGRLFTGSLLFDTSALLYLMAPYALAALLPLPAEWKARSSYNLVLRLLFMLAMVLIVASNLGDALYFPYTGRRTTGTVMGEFAHENNLLGIVAAEMLRRWYIVIAGVVMLWASWRCYRSVSPFPWERKSCWRSTAAALLALVCYVPLSVAGIRGGFTTAVRPVTISNAFQYAASPQTAAVVLNTPFSLIRTWNKAVFRDPGYYSAEELDRIYSPVHPASGEEMLRRNVVVMICESLGQEYFGHYNDYEGQTPFLDSLCRESLTFRENYANGRKSIDGMPSVLSSIPMMGEPFLLTPSAMNRVGGLARELGGAGYETGFFHGAQNGSMGFEAFARNSGFQRYWGRTEFDKDERFGGEKEFDGMWAIWDEPFLKFMERMLTEQTKEPFMAAVFTASSHHPYRIPEQYEEQFPDNPENPMHRCVRYLDLSLRRFFEAAKKEAWFQRTIFVITGDHTNASSHPEYQTEWGVFRVPVIFYDPTGEIFRPEQREGPVQQIDIMPTVLSGLKYNKPYIAFGQDVLSTPDSLLWVVTWQGSLAMRGGNEALRRAVEQSYMQRMLGDSLVIGGKEEKR